MSETERAFLLAAAKNPGDDNLRLVYSDWLEEQAGDAMTAQAQFLRLQVARAKSDQDFFIFAANSLRNFATFGLTTYEQYDWDGFAR